MAEVDIDFEGTGGSGTSSSSGQQDNNNSQNGNGTQEETTNLNGGGNDDITGKDNQNNNGGEGEDNNNGGDNDNSSTGELTEGTEIEFDGATYTVDANGNLVDEKGTIFKEAKDVADWMKSMDVDDSNDNDEALTLASIQEAIGITVTDADGNDIEFTNDAAGIKAYVNSVIDLKSNEIQQATINKFYQDNPLVKQFTDYVQLNGTPRGFGEIPDRTGIVLDKDNTAQLEAVIKMAAAEFGNKSLNDNYIKYLKDGGGLYDEAKQQLAALQEKDKQYREAIAKEAAAQRAAEEKAVTDYWTNVNKVIDSRIIAGYKLPESFTKEVNGQKVIFTPNDFYNYLSKATETDTDGNKVTGYQRDLNQLTDEEYLNRELLTAWLMYTNGDFKDLIDMAVKEEQVRKLRVKAKEQRSTKSIKVIKKQGKSSIDDIIL